MHHKQDGLDNIDPLFSYHYDYWRAIMRKLYSLNPLQPKTMKGNGRKGWVKGNESSLVNEESKGIRPNWTNKVCFCPLSSLVWEGRRRASWSHLIVYVEKLIIPRPTPISWWGTERHWKWKKKQIRKEGARPTPLIMPKQVSPLKGDLMSGIDWPCHMNRRYQNQIYATPGNQ